MKIEITAWQTEWLEDNHDTLIVELIRIQIFIGGKCAIAFIDPGSQENLIGQQAVKRLRIKLQEKKQPLQPYGIEGAEILNSTITHDIVPVKL
jgi:hypothetical protein